MATRRPRSALPGAPAPTPEPELFERDPGMDGLAFVQPASTPAPTAAPITVNEDGSEHATPPGAQPPVRLTKLAAALQKISKHVDDIRGMDVDIEDMLAKYPAGHKFDVATDAGYKAADATRKKARELRLDVQRMAKDGNDLLNGLKAELKAIADPTIEKLQAIEDNAKAQRDAHDKLEEDRKKRHADAIAAIGRLAEGVATLRSAEVLTRRASLMAIIVDNSYQEFEAEAKAKHGDVAKVLEEAYDAAVKREAEEQAQAKRDAQDKAARERIAMYKAMPEEVADTGLENVQRLIGSMQEKDEDEEKYGSLAEFVDMARVKALGELNLLAEGLEHDAEEAGPFYWSHPESDSHGQVETREELERLLDADPLANAITKEQFDHLEARAAERLRTVAGTPAAEPDPFTGEAMRATATPYVRDRTDAEALSAPPVAAPAPRRVARAALPVLTPAPTTAPTAAPTPAPTAAPAEAMPAAAAVAAAQHVASIHEAARLVRAAFLALNDEEAKRLPAPLRAALNGLYNAFRSNP